MQKVIVIGGGLAGLSSAVYLASKNIPVEVIESSSRLGGRVTSFYDPVFGEIIDNGQHIMMGCYTSTLEFLKIIGAERNFKFQDNIEVKFLKDKIVYSLKAGVGLYPFNFIGALLNFKLLSFKERIKLLIFFLMLPLTSTKDLENMTAEEWLCESQDENIRRCFWDIFIIGALNTTPAKASALVLRETLIKVFLSGRKASAIILPIKPLAEAFCTPAAEYLKKQGSEITLSERVIRIQKDYRNRITRIITNKRTITDFTYVVCSVPFYSLEKIIPQNFSFKAEYSPILNFFIRTKKKLFDDDFIALTDSPIHWIFRHENYYTAVISSADNLVDKERDELKNLTYQELKKHFGLDPTCITAFRVIKEKRATFIPSNDIRGKRPLNSTERSNFFLAGDWIETGFPATIEGAVESGKRAHEEIIKQI